MRAVLKRSPPQRGSTALNTDPPLLLLNTGPLLLLSGGGVHLTFQVSKPEGPVGELRLGPMQKNQRVVFGRVPSCDVVMEHLSVSRQHAVRT